MATATKSKTVIKPLDDRILVKPTDPETKTASGIYLPEGAQEKPMTGKVVAVGPGKLTDDGNRAKPGVKKGDLVIYGKYGGTEVDIDGFEHQILRENDILGVVEK
jgi:chaperonin GroES